MYTVILTCKNHQFIIRNGDHRP